jgi:2-polyprenyl-3-methyl-5-hydroxy-6-metoxy-1,4-benzoquinol methylase
MGKFMVTTSWDDGSIYDLRLAELLSKYQIPATFYIPIKNPERKVMSIREIRELGRVFEIGGHTVNHQVLTEISLKEAKKEIVSGKKKLENIIGREIISFCYPKGMYNQDVKQLVGFSGFTYARTVRLFGTQILDKLQAPTSVHAFDHKPLLYLRELGPGWIAKASNGVKKLGVIGKSWDEIAIYWLNYCKKVGGVYHLWGHSWEIEERGDWEKLEKVLSYISRHTDKKQRKTNGNLLSELEKDKKRYYESLDPTKYKSNMKVLAQLTNDFDKSIMRILDIGCGNGRASELFPRADYIGIDFAKNFIDYAKERYPIRRFYLTDFGTIKSLGLSKQDLIIIWGMFEDVTDPFRKLKQINELVKKGTRIIFTLHNRQSKAFRFIKFLQSKSSGGIFPYTSFSKNFLVKEFGVKVMELGPTLVVILNK